MKELVLHERKIQRSNDTFEDAKLLADNGRWNSVVNRVYYACFYAVSALLYSKGIEPKTHAGIRTIFFDEYIKTGLIEKDFGKLYSDLFDLRQEGDYSDFVIFEKELVEPLLSKSVDLLDTVNSLIRSNL